MTATLLRDVIPIPERTGDEDYVLKLTEGVDADRIAETVRDYVVTDDISRAFDQALGLVGSALRDGQSRAAWLTGSFGSGKSHFMAILHGLLGNNPHARSLQDLQPVIATHDPTLQGKHVLRLACHFLTATTFEEVLFGSYVDQISQLHPKADLPAVHRGDPVVDNGEGMRKRLGDERFFAELSGSVDGTAAGGGDVWGSVLDGTWDSTRYEAARAAAPGSEQRQQLVTALARTYFPAYTKLGEYVGIDEGLDAITRHAKGLGYDAVVLFLDELVLWLTYLVHDRLRFGDEVQKLTKLVEGGSGARAVPLVSLVARQMDLRKYFKESAEGMGAEHDALDSALRHQEGRFATIALGDANLPYVAQKRLLAPHPDNPDATAIIDEAFRNLDRRPAVWDTLLDGVNTGEQHRGADQESFRRTYPFSPALVSTLRVLASAMQRDRTALKVMQQLLVHQRAELTVDDVVPAGDIFDYVVQGERAISPEMERTFRGARKLYDDKLRPLLLREHGLTDSGAHQLPRDHAFRTDDRLVKTLLLSAVAPEVPALKELTAQRLAALNHGSIVSPLPGQEASVVLTKLQKWQRHVPEIHIADGSRNPVIRMRIAQVDYESVVERARAEDNDGRRKHLLKRLVWEAFGVSDIDGDVQGISRHRVVWRGTPREVELRFGNIRDRFELPDAAFEALSTGWRFVVDFPYDEHGHSAREDLARLDELRASDTPRNLIAWVPRFLTRQRRDDLGRLVILDWLFGRTGERWAQHADHLSEMDRAQAKTVLESQYTALWNDLRKAVQQAYGAATLQPDTVQDDDGHDRVLVSLHPVCTPAEPVGSDLQAAFGNLINQAFSALYPGHPKFEPENQPVKSSEVTEVLTAVESGKQEEDGRTYVEPAKRAALTRVANPLGLGRMGETHFNVHPQYVAWNRKFEIAMGQAGLGAGDPVEVAALRRWIATDEVGAGLRTEHSDLIICAWAIVNNRAWYRYGQPCTPTPAPGKLTPDMELRPEPLPDPDNWQTAVQRAQVLFGTHTNRHLTGAALNDFAEAVRRVLQQRGSDAARLVRAIEAAYQRLGMSTEEGAGRLATARTVDGLIERLRQAGDRVSLVQRLADAELPDEHTRMARSLVYASGVIDALENAPWERLEPLVRAQSTNTLQASDSSGGSAVSGRSDLARDSREHQARAILDRLRAALRADEFVEQIEPALRVAENEAFDWALHSGPSTPPVPSAGPAHRTVPEPATDRAESTGAGTPHAPAPLPTYASTVNQSNIPATGGPTTEASATASGRTTQWRISSDADLDGAVAELRAALADEPGIPVVLQWWAER